MKTRQSGYSKGLDHRSKMEEVVPETVLLRSINTKQSHMEKFESHHFILSNFFLFKQYKFECNTFS